MFDTANNACTLQVLAVSCQDLKSSPVASMQINIMPAPNVLVELTFGGRLSISEISSSVQQLLETAIASSLGLQPALVQLVSLKNIRRRLLALSVTFRILAKNPADALMLKERIASADLGGAIKKRAGEDFLVSSVAVQVENTAASQNGSQVTLIIAAVAGSVGFIILVVVVVLALRKYKLRQKQDRETHQVTSSSSEETIIL